MKVFVVIRKSHNGWDGEHRPEEVLGVYTEEMVAHCKCADDGPGQDTHDVVQTYVDLDEEEIKKNYWWNFPGYEPGGEKA